MSATVSHKPTDINNYATTLSLYICRQYYSDKTAMITN